MNLEKKILEKLKEAMKSKNVIALEALRAIKSELLLLKTKNKDAKISEKDEVKLLQKLVKQRKDSAEIYLDQNRKDLADTELLQLTIIEQFLPEQLSEEEVSKEILRIIESEGVSSIKDMGRIMKLATEKIGGRSDGKTMSKIIRQHLL